MAAAAVAPIVTHEPPPVSVGSNEGKIPQHDLAWLKETPTDTPLAEMQRRLREDGYVFVKNLIPKEDVLKVRSEYFDSYTPTGMLEPGTTTEEGIFNSKQSASAHGGIGARDLPVSDLEVQTLINAHTAPEYLDFVAHRDLRSFVRRLMGWDKEILLQRTMLRHNVPGADTTAVHYDKLFLRGGEAFCLTAWVPIGDISQIGGGLVYLADSAALGKSIEDDFTARAAHMTAEERRSAFNANMARGGMLSQDAGEFSDKHNYRRWLVANYEAGDVVFHDPYMIHTSSVNQDPSGKIRLSTDLRFYREGDDMDKRWMKFWTPGDGL